MATSDRTATARLCRAPGLRRTISRSPASTCRRIVLLLCRKISGAQSIIGISGDPAYAPRAPGRRAPRELPQASRAGGGLARPVPVAEGRLERDLLVGDGDGAGTLRDDQRLQAEGVLRVAE